MSHACEELMWKGHSFLSPARCMVPQDRGPVLHKREWMTWCYEETASGVRSNHHALPQSYPIQWSIKGQNISYKNFVLVPAFTFWPLTFIPVLKTSAAKASHIAVHTDVQSCCSCSDWLIVLPDSLSSWRSEFRLRNMLARDSGICRTVRWTWLQKAIKRSIVVFHRSVMPLTCTRIDTA